MAEPNIMDLKNCTFKLRDGATPTPNELTLYLDEGNLTWRERREIEYKMNRGVLSTAAVRFGDDVPMEVSLQCRFSAIKSNTGESVTVSEFLKKEGAASNFTSVGDACEPFAIDLIVEVNHTCGTVVDEIITFPDFRVEEIGGDFRAGTLDLSGRCKAVAPTSVRSNLS